MPQPRRSTYKKKKPVVKPVIPRGNNNFDPEDPAHYAAAYLERVCALGAKIAWRLKKGGCLHPSDLEEWTLKYQISEAEILEIQNLIEVLLIDHSNGRRLAPYASGRGRSPGS